MLYERIDKEIHDAAVNDDRFALETLRLIKAEFLKYKASKEALKTPMSDAVEITLMQRMMKQRSDAAELYMKGNRPDLAEKETAEAEFIGKFLPKEPTEDEIVDEIHSVISRLNLEPVTRNMGVIIKGVKEKYPTADGKKLAAVVSAMLE